MAYTTYDNPGEFFNCTAPAFAGIAGFTATTSAYAVSGTTITLGLNDSATAAGQFLTNLSTTQANSTTGSTAQVIFSILDALQSRYALIPVAERPTKFSINRIGSVDSNTGELIFSYNVSIRVTADNPIAINS